MQIKDLKPRMGKVDVVVEVTDIGDAKEFSKFGKPGRVATATAKDETGTIKLTLWNEQIDDVGVGDKVQIKNGYVSEWQGEMQLTTGRLGSIEVVGKQKRLGEKKEKEEEDKKEKAVTKKESKKKREEEKEKAAKKKADEEEEEEGGEEKEEWITPEEREEDFDEEELDVDEEDIY